MKYALLLLGVLLTPQATDGIGCELVCNGACGVTSKLCNLVQPNSATCLTAGTTCTTNCAKICTCVSQCGMECLKPQGACKNIDGTPKNLPCTAPGPLCKTVTCPLNCVFSLIPQGVPDLSKLSSGVGNDVLKAPDISKLFSLGYKASQEMPGNLLGKTNALVPLPLPTIPRIPAGIFNLPDSVSKPLTLPPINIGAPNLSALGTSYSNPFGKSPLLSPATTQDSEDAKPPKLNPPSTGGSLPKEPPKPENPISPPASPINRIPAPFPPSKPTKEEPPKRSKVYTFG